LIVHFCSKKRQLRLFVDEYFDAVLMHLFVQLVLGEGVVQGVAQAIASALSNADF
jgi:hypothetical protein